jgi:hypothetical protein
MRFCIVRFPTFPSQQIFVFDLVGISVRSGRNFMPAFYDRGSPLSIKELGDIYTPSSVNWILWWSCPDKRCLGFIANKDEHRELMSAWLGAVIQEPWSYLAHRWDVFSGILGLPERNMSLYWFPAREKMGGHRWNSKWKDRILGYIDRFSDSIIFRPYAYLLSILATLILGAVKGIKARAFWAMGFSGLLYEFSYFVTGQVLRDERR